MAPVTGMPPNIGRTLTDKLGIGVGMATGNAISHSGGQQRLDGGKHRNGEGPRHKVIDYFHIPRKGLWCREIRLHITKAIADGLDSKLRDKAV